MEAHKERQPSESGNLNCNYLDRDELALSAFTENFKSPLIEPRNQ